MGKPSINGPFSMAMLNSQRVVNPSGCSAPCHLSPFLAAASSGNSRSISWKRMAPCLGPQSLDSKQRKKWEHHGFVIGYFIASYFYHTSQLKNRNKL